MVINQNLTFLALTFLGKTIRPVLLAEDLGINLDSYLSYDDHISKLFSLCMRKLCQINRVKDSFDNETLKLVIETLVISKLLYCSTVWSNTSSNNINKLQSVQSYIRGRKVRSHNSGVARTKLVASRKVIIRKGNCNGLQVF